MLETLRVLGAEEWDAALAGSRQPYRFSHRASAGVAFAAAFDSYEHTPCLAVFSDSTELLLPLVMVRRRWRRLEGRLGMPLSLEGTPISLAGRCEKAHLRALPAALGYPGVLQIHGGAGGSPPPVGRVTRGVTHVLDLRPGFESLWADSFGGKNRNSFRKAEREGVTAARCTDSESWATYAALYRQATTDWGYERPPYPDALFDALAACPDADLWLARHDDRVVAGAVLLRGSSDVLYWSGAMDRSAQRLAPVNLVLGHAIRRSCEEGLEYFDFGASSGLDGVDAFKRSFGAQPREYNDAELSRAAYRLTTHVLRSRS